jgi:GntR family transcriptional regulator, rspAB operon transcriptional repressor
MKLELADKQSYESIREYALRILNKNLLNMNLVPGMALSEQEIANELEMSRTPVREAFIRLAHENLLEIVPQKGTYVAKIDLEQVEESIFLRQTMENAVVELACKDFSQESIQRLQDCIDLQELCVKREDFARFFELDGSFHGIIYSSCGKSRIWKMLEQMSLNYNRVRMLNLLNGYYEMPKLFGQHEEIYFSIVNHDWETGKAIIRQHIGKALKDIEELKEKYPLYFR